MASPKESVYLCCHDNNGKNLPLESQIVVFLYAFCDLTAKTCETVLVRNDRVVANDGSQEDSIFHGTGRGLNIKVEEKDVIPACVQKCQLPVLLTNHNGINCCKYGLANVLRNLIYIANDVHPERELLKLLGYNETCLKSCAESSQWTKLCEIEIPESISYFCQHNHRNGTIPFSVLKFEGFLSQPVAMSNIMKKRREVYKKNVGGDSKSFVKIQGDAVAGKQTLKDDDSHSTGHVDIVSSVERLQLHHENTKTTVEVPNVTQRKTQKKKWRNPHSKKIIPVESLPVLPHIFAEGFEMTLSDLVLLPCLHQYLSVAMEIGDQSFLGQMPKILLWYNKMMTVPFISETFSRFGICALTFGDVDSDRINSEALIAVCSKQQILKSRRTLKTNMRRDAPLLINKLKSSGIEVKMDKHPNDKIKLSWSDLPEDVQPIQGTVTEERSQRKCQQIENIVSAVTTIALPGHTIVDFCSGSGHVGITLAYLLPECHIALVENKAESLQRAEKRVKNLKLTNITLYNGNLDYYTAKFDIGVSLHACGVATDMVLDKCIQCNAAFVSAPCCYGSVHTTHVITYPRSQKMRNELTEEEYILLGHSADQTPWQFQSEIAKQGKTSMALIDFDRAEAAREKGYNVSVCTMEPPTCSPKNDLLIGIPVNLSC